ncbi:MAG: hypothetical protein N2V78_05205 [Methanophagales archaeon]|nr:hypothetical protein [Methanophagales archaeon]
MNTKIIVALVIATTLVGLTGAASARETQTSSIYYEFVKTIDGEGIGNINALDDINSCAGWSYDDPRVSQSTPGCPAESAMIQNTLTNTWATTQLDPKGEYEGTVTQTGAAMIIKRPLDSEDDLEEMEASVRKTQDIVVSGQFDKFGAKFDDKAVVGVNYYDPIRGPDIDLGLIPACGNCHLIEESTASGSVVLSGSEPAKTSQISEAAVGTASWTSVSADGWTHLATMGGGSSAYSEFFGDTIVYEDDTITTSSHAKTTHEWAGTRYCGSGGCPTISQPPT